MALFDNLPEAEYRGIRFPLESSDVDGGVDFVEHTAYRRRGADMEPAGVKAYRGTLSIPLINAAPLVERYGTLWPDLRYTLVEEFGAHPIGTLVHPTWGTLEVAILSWSTRDDPTLRNGQRLMVQWQEHNATLASLFDVASGAVTTDPTTTVQSQAEAADALGTTFVGYAPIAPSLAAQMSALEASTILAYSQVQAAFRSMVATVDAALALPSLAVVDAHDLVVQLESVKVSLQGYYARFAPGVTSTSYYIVPVEMSVSEIALAVYADLGKVSLLYAANSFVDPLLVAPGTVVTVLPAS